MFTVIIGIKPMLICGHSNIILSIKNDLVGCVGIGNFMNVPIIKPKPIYYCTQNIFIKININNNIIRIFGI